MKRRNRAVLAAIGLCFILSALGATNAWVLAATVRTAPTLTDLNSVVELKTLFNRDRGKARLVLLLSPT